MVIIMMTIIIDHRSMQCSVIMERLWRREWAALPAAAAVNGKVSLGKVRNQEKL